MSEDKAIEFQKLHRDGGCCVMPNAWMRVARYCWRRRDSLQSALLAPAKWRNILARIMGGNSTARPTRGL